MEHMRSAEGGGHARLTIDLSAAAANYRMLCRLAPSAEVAAVVKADAYGLGVGQLAATFRAEGCRSFFVATPEEGLGLRAVLGAEAHAADQIAIYVLHGLAGGDPAMMEAAGLIPVISTLGDLAIAKAHAGRHQRALPAALHFDTGINRLGLDVEPDSLSGIAPVLVMSHLACADEPGHALNALQLARFEALRAHFPGIRASLANSAGVLLGTAFQFDLVRTGIALYGGNPGKSGANPFRAVARLEAPILQCRRVPAGETVGYGASFETKRDSVIATLGIGYADGLLRSLGNKGSVVLGGKRAPIIGRISMDLITIDVTDIPPDERAPGRYAELIGEAMLLDEVAEAAGTANYELLTRLGQRLHRLYLPAAKGAGL
jgi:alanine racemase